MSRKFKTANYEETLNQTIRLAEALPPQHLARFVVDLIAQLDLSRIYRGYAPVGGEAYAPEVLLGLLFYGYATGLFGSRKIETATYESIPFRYIATGREPHHQDWRTFFAELSAPPGEQASPKEQMAYKLQTEIGKAIYRLRKCTVEPVIGIIKEVIGFRQFSLRGLWAAAGEWCLVCLAFNLKRMHSLYLEQGLI